VTASVVALICSLLIARGQGYGGPAIATLLWWNAALAAMPLALVWIAERAVAFILRQRAAPAGVTARTPTRGASDAAAAPDAAVHAATPVVSAGSPALSAPRSASAVESASLVAQSSCALAMFGWWWLEPHAVLTAWTGASLSSRWWLAALGAIVGAALAAAAARRRDARCAREVSAGTLVAFLLAGGAMYRAADDVAAGERAVAAATIAAAAATCGLLAYVLARGRLRGAAVVLGAAAAIAIALCMLPTAGTQRTAKAGAARESVLLVVIDTLRADAAGAMPGLKTWMPHLARIAGDGVTFTQAISPAPWTLPATVSLLSGWNPHRHRAGASVSPWEVLPGEPRACYLGPALRDAGYVVGAFVNNPYLRPYFGFGRGHLLFRPYHGTADDGVTLALQWQRRIQGRPFFTMLHVMDPHWPFSAPAGFGAERSDCASCDSLGELQYKPTSEATRREVRARYRAEVEYTDAQLGRLYDALNESGALDSAWLIVTSDHGEELWDHGGFLHGHTLYDELLRVPLVVVPPRSRGGVARGSIAGWQVRLEDVAATILDIAGLDGSLAPDGASLLPLIALPQSAPVPARVQLSGYVKSPLDMSYALRGHAYKAIFRPDNPFASEVFHVFSDPREKHNLLSPQADALARLTAGNKLRELQGIVAARGLQLERQPLPQSSAAPDADLLRQLRSLGYAN